MKECMFRARIGKNSNNLLKEAKSVGLKFDIEESIFEKLATVESLKERREEHVKIIEFLDKRIKEIESEKKQEISPELEKELLKVSEIIKNNPSYIDGIVKRINNDFDLDLNKFQLKELIKRVEK